MPKVVDREERHRRLVEALWRVTARDGLFGATVRAVAQEAGMSPGALRHWFPTQEDLWVQAMELVIEAARDELSRLTDEGPPVDAAMRLLRLVLPLDDGSRRANIIWFSFAAAAATRPGLMTVWRTSNAEMARLCGRVIDLVAPDLPVGRRRAESETLFALIDGLALHSALSPDLTPPELIVSLLRAHLERLAVSATA